MQTMTIFKENFYIANEDAIISTTACGNLLPLYIAPNIYYAAKETPWENSLEVLDESEFTSAFTDLENDNVESLVMEIPLLLNLMLETEVTDEDTGEFIIDENDGLPLNTFDEVVGVI